MQPRKPERLESGHGCSSTKLKRSASLPMIHFCFFQSYMGSGLLARWGSTPTPLAITRPISWHLLRNKGPRFPIMVGHRLMGGSLLFSGDIAEAQVHYNQSLALY